MNLLDQIKDLFSQENEIGIVLLKIFNCLGGDMNGQIDFQQYAKFVKKLALLDRAIARVLFDTYDTNNNCQLNYIEYVKSVFSEEFRIIINALDSKDVSKLQKLFESLQEYFTKKEIIEKELLSLFNNKETNLNGYMNSAQFEDFVYKLAKLDKAIARVLFDIAAAAGKFKELINYAQFVTIILSEDFNLAISEPC